jgi:hypothetical protein
MLLPPVLSENPRPAHKRRLMAHVLAMSAGQIGHPVAVFVLMKTDDGLMHHLPIRRLFSRSYFIANDGGCTSIIAGCTNHGDSRHCEERYLIHRLFHTTVTLMVFGSTKTLSGS